MEELHLAKELLGTILHDDVKFSVALRDKFVSDVSVRNYRKSVSGLIGSELRHHLLVVYLTKDIDLSEDEKLYCYLALAELYYYRRLDDASMMEDLKVVLTPEHFEAMQPLFDKAGKPEEYLPADMPTGFEKFSLQYNCPEWVLRIWHHYGDRIAYKIIRANVKKAPITVRLANPRIAEEDFLNDGNFKKTNVEGIYNYVGTEPLRKNKYFIDKSIFVERPAIKATLDKFKVSEPSEALLFNGAKNDVVMREFLATYGKTLGYNIGVYKIEDYAEFAKTLGHNRYNNVNFFAADPLAMTASVSGPQDLVVCCPESTNFDMIREEPDYLLHFKKDEMDGIFAREKEALEGCSHFVADQGTLIYMIMTISRKEGHATVADFLKQHSEFTLVNELQLYPFDDLGTSMYYAVLHKSQDELKITPPLGDLKDISAEAGGFACSEK